MARNRKLGKTTDQRLAMLRTLTTDVILRGKIVTTETRAKEVKAIVDSLVALAVKEKDNFETVDAKVITAKYLKVVKEEKTVSRQKDMPSRLNARKKMMKMVNKVKDEDGKNVDLPGKLFNEIAPKYTNNVGGYTRIVKVGPRKGDNAPMAILELL